MRACSSLSPCRPKASPIASETSVKIELGKFNIFSMIELPTNWPMYGGIGNTTSKRDGFASPSFPRMFDKNKFGENDI